MSRPFHPDPFHRQNGWAILLVLLGLAGMIHHLAFKPEASAMAASAGLTNGRRYIAPATAFPRNQATPADPSPLKDWRRRLQEFIIPLPGVKSLPVQDAIAVLQHHWQTLPHETDQIPPAGFGLTADAQEQLASTNPAPLVSLEIPGVSILSNLRLLAAQTGLKVTITESGAVLQPDSGSTDRTAQSATTPLSQATINQYLLRANRLSRGQDTGDAGDSGSLNASGKDSGVKVTVRLVKKPGGDPARAGQPGLLGKAPEAQERSDPTKEHAIDLQMAPEVTKLVGFLSDGTAMRTSDIHAVSDTDPNVLTDSGIPWPVFPTRTLPDTRRQALENLFGSMGIAQQENPDGYTWSPLEGNLIATGSRRTLQVAAALAAALEEAALSGVKLELLAADWLDQKPPQEPSLKSLKKAGPAGPGSPSHGHAPFSYTPATLRLRFGRGRSVIIPPPPSRHFILLPEPGNKVHAQVESIGARFTVDLQVSVPDQVNLLLTPGSGSGDGFSKTFHGMTCRNSQWHRVDLPVREGEDPALKQSVFLRAARSTIGAEE